MEKALEKIVKLEKYIDYISDCTGLPMAIVKIEIADDIGADYENLTAEDIDAMVKLCEQEMPKLKELF